MQSIFLTSLGSLLLVTAVEAAEKQWAVLVQAGEFDRKGAVATVNLPENSKRNGWELRAEGKVVPLQLGGNSRGTFIVEQLKKGTEAKYVLVESKPGRNGGNQISARKEKDGVKLSSNGRVLMNYQMEPGALPRDHIKPAFLRGGYLHPILTPSGKLVTDDYPANHIHHHGVWWAWTKTKFADREPDFWNMGDGKGRVEFASLDDTWNGSVHGGFRAQHRFVDLTAPKPTTVLNESWEVAVYAAFKREDAYWMFDLVSQQQCATDTPLKLPDYRYGGVGVRGNWAWNGKDKTYFLTSEGETDRDKGNATRGRWCDMGGEVDGARVGIAILCHPENFRAPQPMRLHPTEPFFNFAPQQAGDMEIKPGQRYISRYRFVVHDGPPDRAELDRLWNDYAHPPVVKVEQR